MRNKPLRQSKQSRDLTKRCDQARSTLFPLPVRAGFVVHSAYMAGSKPAQRHRGTLPGQVMLARALAVRELTEKEAEKVLSGHSGT